jgi:hypothetical protein
MMKARFFRLLVVVAGWGLSVEQTIETRWEKIQVDDEFVGAVVVARRAYIRKSSTIERRWRRYDTSQARRGAPRWHSGGIIKLIGPVAFFPPSAWSMLPAPPPARRSSYISTRGLWFILRLTWTNNGRGMLVGKKDAFYRCYVQTLLIPKIFFLTIRRLFWQVTTLSRVDVYNMVEFQRSVIFPINNTKFLARWTIGAYYKYVKAHRK